MKVVYYGDTNIGNQRTSNEDTFLLKRICNGKYLLSVVIDGVGGCYGGRVAADIARKCISEHVTNYADKTNSTDVLKAAVINANNLICSQHCIPSLSEMCCVLTAILINLETGCVNVEHIGDTRLYLFKDGVLTKLTSDHTYVGGLEESGQITEKEAMAHVRRNVISRYVGLKELQWGTDYIQTHKLQIPDNCTLLMCSDGLYDMVHSLQMVKILREPVSVEEKVKNLIDAALDGGGRDNITVVLIDVAMDTYNTSAF